MKNLFRARSGSSRKIFQVLRPGALLLASSCLSMCVAIPGRVFAQSQQQSGIGVVHHRKQWLIQVTYTNGGPFGTTGIIGTPTGVPWTEANFQKWAKEGITGVEMNMDWQAMEPSPGVYNFSQVEQYCREAYEAGIQLIPIFWESMWHPGNPPTWLQFTPEESSTGQVDDWPITVYVGNGPVSGLIPAMWSHRALQAYTQFVTHAYQALSSVPGFGGAYVDVGWLDAVYGPTPTGSGIEGYAAPDIAEYHIWLQKRYGTIQNLNEALGTNYPSFDAVPAFTPGEAHFNIYQQFRAWSYAAILSHIYQSIRQVSQKPIYIYFGGDMSTAGTFMNIPDIDFEIAKRYHAIINLDTAGHLGYAELFGYLSQAYHVPVIYEWTPTGSVSQDVSLMAQWMGHVSQEGPYGDGADYFADLGSGHQFNFYSATFPTYLAQKSVMEEIRGSQPQYPVGIMLGYDQIFNNDNNIGITGGLSLLGSYLRSVRPAADVFTDLSVLDGAVSLKQFHTIIDWNNDLTAPNLNPVLKEDLEQFVKEGGTIIPGPIEANANAFTIVDQPDGQYTTQEVDGQLAVVSEEGVGGTSPYSQYLYFKVPSSLVPPNQPNVTITVTYANNQDNAFFLQYDSSNTSAPVNGAYASAFPVGSTSPVTVTTSGTYSTATFELNNALFEGAENGGADFRIAVEHPGLAVSQVTVEADGQSATFTPSELSMPIVPSAVQVSPNASNVEALLTVGHGKLWLVASNIGSQPFDGTISLPTNVLSMLLPSSQGAPITTESLEGTWQEVGSNSWSVSLPVGQLAVLEISPEVGRSG
ncbi:MAG: beta-galactosidase [Firmicutes bacterium]|nr:beta-galactosidase [Bacillota bacterium]